MFERASACLDSGRRSLLRKSCHQYQARRKLHSAFWHHGAGDLHLPGSASWWASILQHDPKYQPRRRDSSINNPSWIYDSPFLDFLYPLQTIAFINRISRKNLEHWRKNGVALAPLRPYSSCSETSSENRPSSETLSSPETPPFLEIPLSTETSSSDARVLAELEDWNTSKSNFSSENPGKELDAILQSPGKEDQDEAWSLYCQLGEDEKNPRMQEQLLRYLAQSRRHIDRHRTKALFHILKDHDIDASTYRATIKSLIYKNEFEDAIKAHELAISKNVHGNFGSSSLIARLIQTENWEAAVDINESFVRFQREEKGEKLYGALLDLWNEVGELPDVVELALSYSKHIAPFVTFQSEQWAPIRIAAYDHFTHELTMRACRQAAYADYKSVQTLFTMYMLPRSSLNHRAQFRASHYEEAMMSYAQNPAPDKDYNEKSKRAMTRWLYRLYRASDAFEPSPWFLHILIKDACRFAIDNRSRPKVQTLLEDWRNFHGVLPKHTTDTLMRAFARSGDIESVTKFFNQLRESGAQVDYVSAHTVLYANARLGRVDDAVQFFERMSTDFGITPEKGAWNIVLHAYARADDIDGASRWFERIVNTNKLDPFSFGPVLDLCARRGDVEGVRELLDLAHNKGVPITSAMQSSIVLAYVNEDDLVSAEAYADDAAQMMAIKEHWDPHRVESTTTTWNILLTAYALRRDMISFLRVYRRMQDANVPFDTFTYAALIQALCMLGQVEKAYKILRKTMRRNRFRILAFHWTIIILGFVSSGRPLSAIEVYHDMKKYTRTQPTAAIEMAYLQARIQEKFRMQPSEPLQRRGFALRVLHRSLKRVLTSGYLDIASKQPSIGLQGRMTPIGFPDTYFEYVFERINPAFSDKDVYHAVKSLFDVYVEAKGGQDRDILPPIRIISALMASHFRQNRYRQIEELWNLVLSEAELFARKFSILKRSERTFELMKRNERTSELNSVNEKSTMSEISSGDVQSTTEHMSQMQDMSAPEDGTSIYKPLIQLPTQSIYSLPTVTKPVPSTSNKIFTKVITSTGQDNEHKESLPPSLLYPPKIDPARLNVHDPIISRNRAGILAYPLYINLRCLARNRKYAKMGEVISDVMSRGYIIDNRIWNFYIQTMARAQYAILAFRTCEEYLIPNWPGWKPQTFSSNLFFKNTDTPGFRGFDHICTRGRVKPGTLLPTYKTMVCLTGAARRVRRADNRGEKIRGMRFGMTQLRSIAPRTVGAVSDLPVSHDKVQEMELKM
ncbi:hypothetical protein M501DRAFT_995935 [Patellaria atrata CBS 101060]|uniref:Pentacotripeptide-repeat region of PRORP domain-containing protein n=1 Tax=Patellaria atrata CBS 101060 TaxID=1346257 RepID=A0A9P4S946_9PEZI|nr:hypothetical protein M501DRAFT_995935 [Patellaria atrata CBS 101060]